MIFNTKLTTDYIGIHKGYFCQRNLHKKSANLKTKKPELKLQSPQKETDWIMKSLNCVDAVETRQCFLESLLSYPDTQLLTTGTSTYPQLRSSCASKNIPVKYLCQPYWWCNHRKLYSIFYSQSGYQTSLSCIQFDLNKIIKS